MGMNFRSFLVAGFFSSACFGLSYAADAAAVKAFPEALGFGANVTGGRGGTVYHVTNLNDSGEGSFRDAVSAPNRIVVFDVGGIINIKSAVSVKSNITIAGQTAPGEGIAIHGGKVSTGKQSNIIIRYLRIRPGENTASEKDDALNLYDSKDIIVDHCSIELAPWNNFGGSSDNASYRITGVTVQNSLVANPIGQQFGAHIESVDGTWAWYYNAFINTHNRNPLDKINDVFVNNVHYNFEAGYTTHTSTHFKHDIVNNYFVYGPKGSNPWFQVDKNQSIYASGNMIDTNCDGILNGGPSSIYYYQGEGEVLTKPWSEETTKNPIYSAATAWRLVNSQSGVLPYDDIDSLIWHQASTLGKEGALVKSVGAMGLKENGGWGYVQAGTAPQDSDKDGIPDYFEDAMGYDKSKNDATVKSSDGYLFIEKYINWLGAMHMSAPQNGSAEFDLRTITRAFLEVSPAYTVEPVEGGSVVLNADGYTVTFTPAANFRGLAAFKYTVKGNDGTDYTGRVEVLVEKSDIPATDPDVIPSSSSASVLPGTDPESQISSSSVTPSDIEEPGTDPEPQSSSPSVTPSDVEEPGTDPEPQINSSSVTPSDVEEPGTALESQGLWAERLYAYSAFASFDFERGVVKSPCSGFAVVSLFDFRGRLVARFSGPVKVGETRLNFDKSSLPQGAFRSIVHIR